MGRPCKASTSSPSPKAKAIVRPKRQTAVTPKQKRKISRDSSADSNEDGDSSDPNEIVGRNVFTFRTPKRKNQMSAKATLTAERFKLLEKRKTHEERTSKATTPKSTKRYDETSSMSMVSPSVPSETPQRTPHAVRRKIKSRLKKMVAEKDGSSSGDSSSESGDNDSEPEVATAEVNGNSRPRRSCRATTTKGAAEKYFASRDKDAKTSDNTLAKLDLPKLDRESLRDVLSQMPRSHVKEIEILTQSYEEHFPKWIFRLSQGFNLILYGLGSKFSLLQKFSNELVDKNLVLVVNGFFPGLTIKQMLHSISHDLLDHEHTFVRQDDHVRFIHETLDDKNERLYLLVHNVDGAALRNEAAQNLLCSLVGHDRVHLVASVDHINAPLLWDQRKMSRLNWLWQDVTTMEPYLRETSYENSLFVKQSGSLALSSLRHVFHSLTPNARNIFLLLARHQLEHCGTKNYAGMAFHDCYRQCREAFLVNSELTLKAQLTEFKDHVLLKTKKGSDGSDHLLIPLDSNTMTEFLRQQEKQ